MSSSATTTSATTHPIPLPYRVIFTIIDPLFCLYGFLQHILAPRTTLLGYSDYAPIPPAASTVFILDNLAGLFALLFVLEFVALRYTHSRDVELWKIVQLGGLLVDVCMVWGAGKMLLEEGRLLDVQAWRGDDWKNLVGNVGMGVARALVAAGLGLGEARVKGKTA